MPRLLSTSFLPMRLPFLAFVSELALAALEETSVYVGFVKL